MAGSADAPRAPGPPVRDGRGLGRAVGGGLVALRVEALDRRADHDLGNLDEPGNPSFQQYQHDHTRAWGALIDSFDGYVFLVPEYNRAYPGALKNALDYVYREWNDKAAGIISYGGWVAGARAAEALRLVLAELQVATVRAQPAISTHPSFRTGAFVPQEGLDTGVEGMLDQLIAWSGALRGVRRAKAQPATAA
ncbi:NADPH-dependent FMN reductase [Streptomyces sp. NPDC013172]|uniref:NADPH-dependent FMN reductase n=1 Tax=Streptomyces sp. NPDC013172 TaxID=3155009 RepID=UPI0033CA80B1